MHEGNTTTEANTIVLQPLTPLSNYLIKVSALTPRGQGEEAIIEANTGRVDSQYGMSA